MVEQTYEAYEAARALAVTLRSAGLGATDPQRVKAEEAERLLADCWHLIPAIDRWQYLRLRRER